MLYTLIQIAGMQRYGRRAWLENGEAFGVYFGLIAAMAPLARDPDGRVVIARSSQASRGSRRDPASCP